MTEIDHLAERFNRAVDLTSVVEEHNSNQVENMTTSGNVNYQLLKLYVDTIPHYNGDGNTLEIFISACDYLMTNYGNTADAQLVAYLLRVVIGKLTDRAQLLIATRPELNSWDSIKKALRLSFGDQRNIDCLEQDLITMFPMRNEQPLDFAKRIQVARSRLASKVSSLSETEMPRATKIIYLKQYDNLALKTFIRGLTGHLQSIVRLRNPDTLELAMTYVTEEENFKYTQNMAYSLAHPKSIHTNQIRKPHSNTHVQRPNQYAHTHFTFPPPTQPQQPQPTFANANHANNFQQNTPTQKFPSQPINIQPRPVQHHFRSAERVFGTPKNVWKPTGQKPNNNFVEKMSTSSRVPTVRQPSSNFFKTSGPRNFVSEELFQIDDASEVEDPSVFYVESKDEIDLEQDTYDTSYIEPDTQNFHDEQTITTTT